MQRVVHFERCVEVAERAAKFYKGGFGWDIRKWSGPVDYWLITTGPRDQLGIEGALKHRADPEVKTIFTVEVPILEECLQRVVSCGGKVLMGKTPIPGIGYHAYCLDSEGIIFGLMQTGPGA